jgi:acyl dehydratase
MNPVFPGDTLITEGWRASADRYILRTSNQAGATVLGNVVAEIVSA